nr:hypothetical protein [Candidatus Njordarchaeum guaymaensis]
MCENFVCIKLVAGESSRGLPERYLPEPCFEHNNCQICELIYNCDYCFSKDKCRYATGKTTAKIQRERETASTPET